ncbi:MAG: ATP-binding protein [Defluviitaleaceae bacterium]|nr:ATP-binding protein [Defluviitaleaceae bacterium]
METVNITYQDGQGNIKVKIDNEKCIACGKCLTACRHDARYYADDTERFFADLANGEKISLIAAPAIRSTIPEWKNLFTYLKQQGVNKIYDVSLGADLCIWAHVRHMEHNASPLITQPCPVIVSYCEMYNQRLLGNLSPVHSPMACAAIYMKEYEGITDRIAALSPCVGKKREFDATGLAHYNVTFAALRDYLEKNKIKLPKKQTSFDHAESGLGVVFPTPGGLKENIEFVSGKRVSIDRCEGGHVYEMLETYAGTGRESLPDIFDVLNCENGCSAGTACSDRDNIFMINRVVDGNRKAVTDSRTKEDYAEQYKKYNETLNLSLFMRKYKPYSVPVPEMMKISGEDIENAFLALGKTDEAKKNINCCACGSDTCLEMARKIALGVNIPKNCIVKMMDESMGTQFQLAEMEKLHEADERIRIMLDTTPMGAHFWDENLNIVECNQAAAKLFDLDDKQEYIARYFEFTPEFQPDGTRSEEKLRQMINQAYETGYHKAEWMRQTQDGEPVPVEVTLVRVKFHDKDLVASYCRDMREHKRMLSALAMALDKAETAIMASESAQSTTAAMFGANPQINVLFNPKFEAVDCNPAAVNFMGYRSKDEALMDFLDRFFHSLPVFQSNGRPSVSVGEMLVRAVTEGSVKFETEVIIKGEEKTVIVEFISIPYENDYGVVAYVNDITATREREKELTRIREMSELQLAKLDLIVTASRIGLWDMEIIQGDPVNPKNVFTCSKEFRHMLGFNDEQDFPNILDSWSSRLHPDDKERTVNAFAAHMLDKTGKTPYDIEYRCKKKNGEYAYFRASGETIRDEQGNPLRVAGALMDITETKNILQSTEMQRLEAEAANQAKSAFLSTMSHEIRTPMNAILGITEIQLANSDLDQDVRNALEKIYTSGDMLLGIINDILDLSKIEAGKMEIVSANYETASLISDTAQLNMMRIGSKKIDFDLIIDENLPALLLGDELRIKQILNNVLSNAFKYTEKGTVTMALSAGPCVNDDSRIILSVSVSDTGQGMTKEQVAALFDEYSRFNHEANRSTEGTGLGMSITRNLIRMMNGDIGIESEPGKGSTFTVSLPQGKVNDELLGREKAENLHQFRTASRAQMKRLQINRDPMPYGKVLIVDDVETNIFVARGLLTPYQLQIDSVDSGFAAINKVEDGHVYDIIFMDHMMPQMDGVETTGRLRALGYAHPIVALTANAVAGQAEIFLGNGFDDYISKPIDVRQLNVVLNKWVRDKQPQNVVEEAREQAINKKEPSPDSKIIDIFARDARKSIGVLNAVYDTFKKDKDKYTEESMRTYTIHTHGMRSALANVGNMGLSAVALKLEQLGRDKNIGTILSETPAFLTSLQAYVDKITAKRSGPNTPNITEDTAYLAERLGMIKAACEAYDEEAAEAALSQLKQGTWSAATAELLDKIAEHLLHSDFDEITDFIAAGIGD